MGRRVAHYALSQVVIYLAAVVCFLLSQIEFVALLYMVCFSGGEGRGVASLGRVCKVGNSALAGALPLQTRFRLRCFESGGPVVGTHL